VVILFPLSHTPFFFTPMSRPPSIGHGVAYDPVPNPQEPSDTLQSPYDPPSELPAPVANMNDELNPDEQSVHLVPPRFLGTGDGEGIRESLASYGSRAHSEAYSSLYALNPESLSARGSPRPESQDFAVRYRDDPRSLSDDAFDGTAVPLSTLSSQPRFLSEKQAVYPPKASKSRRNTIILSALGGLVLLIVAVILPVYFLAIKHTSNKSATNNPSHTTTAASPSGTKSPSTQKNIITGGDGSTVTMDNGTTFTYNNSFGGYWYYNPADPFNNAARAQSWVPALNETFQFGSDRIRGYVTFFDILMPLRRFS
jgi:glucan 1,3-beta-glucosidase